MGLGDAMPSTLRLSTLMEMTGRSGRWKKFVRSADRTRLARPRRTSSSARLRTPSSPPVTPSSALATAASRSPAAFGSKRAAKER